MLCGDNAAVIVTYVGHSGFQPAFRMLLVIIATVHLYTVLAAVQHTAWLNHNVCVCWHTIFYLVDAKKSWPPSP